MFIFVAERGDITMSAGEQRSTENNPGNCLVDEIRHWVIGFRA
jgi:hypothetical protein